MYHYDPTTALEELNEDAALPNPVHLRDMMLRAHLDTEHSLEFNRSLWNIRGVSARCRNWDASCCKDWMKWREK